MQAEATAKITIVAARQRHRAVVAREVWRLRHQWVECPS